ncbi:2669_t:CDS:1 [Paraglomus brasilianum]|uniref:2669_t:CDS:1 n=1 Tax=Paraglomus brasilianum TaxID=144538 RepID=A0A9N8VYC9_9GLOM|nr:2669_t:CDS:1 [Paraglomus brasilianum]
MSSLRNRSPLRLLTISLLVIQVVVFVFIVITAALLGGWISDTEKFLSAFISEYTDFKGFSVSIHGYPADVYIALIVTGLSVIVGLPLLIPEVINRFKLSLYFAIMEAVLCGLWLITAIIISTGAGMTDDLFAVRLVKPYSDYLYPDQQPYFQFLKKAASLGSVIGIFSYINAVIWGCGALLRFRVLKMMQRKTSNERRGTIPQPYKMESIGVEENVDAKVENEDDSQSNVLTAQQLHELRLKKLRSAKDDEEGEEEMLKFVEIQVPIRPKIELGEKFNVNANNDFYGNRDEDDVQSFPAPILSPPFPPPPPPKSERSANEVRAPFDFVGQESMQE